MMFNPAKLQRLTTVRRSPTHWRAPSAEILTASAFAHRRRRIVSATGVGFERARVRLNRRELLPSCMCLSQEDQFRPRTALAREHRLKEKILRPRGTIFVVNNGALTNRER